MKNKKRFYLLRNHDSIFIKIKKSLFKINRWFRHHWYPLNHAEIEMLNQVFEGWEKVKMHDIIRIQNEDYFIEKTKFRFNCILSAHDPSARYIEIEYRDKENVLISVSSGHPPLMGVDFYQWFEKENNKWVKSGDEHWPL